MVLGTETIAGLGPWALQGGILLFCAFVQSIVGFGFSLFANALLLLAGLALPQTVMLSSLASLLQKLLMTARLREHVPWRETWLLSGISLLTIPLGIMILELGSRQSLGFAKVGLGTLMLVILGVQWLWHVAPQKVLHWGWGALAGVSSGVLTGLANIGGPPLLLWVHAHDWPNEKTRVTVVAISAIIAPLQLVLMLFAFGRGVLPAPIQALVLAPMVAVGTAVGLAVGGRLSRTRLRTAAYGLLVVTCLVCILQPVLAGP